MLLYLSILLVAVHSSITKTNLSHMLLCSALLLVLSLIIAYVKPYKSGYMNISLSFHSAVLGFATGVIILWTEDYIISPHQVAQVFTFLVFLPHLLALMTAVYYILNRTHFTRTVIQLSLTKISAILCCIRTRDTIEPLPDRLENSYAYRTIPDI